MKKYYVTNKKVSYGIKKKLLSNSKSRQEPFHVLYKMGSYPLCLSAVLFEYRAMLSRCGWRTRPGIMKRARDRLCREFTYVDL